MKTIGDVIIGVANIPKQLKRCPHLKTTIIDDKKYCVNCGKEEERCPHIQRKQAGDETYDICELNTKPCLVEHNLYKCETWNEIQKELENELL